MTLKTVAGLVGAIAMVTLPAAVAAQPYARFKLQTDTIQVPGNTNFLVQSNWTIEARVMFCSSLPGGNRFNVIYQEQLTTGSPTTAEDKALDGHTTGFLGTAYRGSGPEYIEYITPISADTWHHLAFVGDATEECLYLDGDEKFCRPRMFAVNDNDGSYRSIGFFDEPPPGTGTRPSFLGLIDTLRIDRQRLYIGDFVPPTGDLSVAGQTVLLYNFNETSGGTVFDSSGYNFDGTLGPTAENPTATSPELGKCGCTAACGDGCVDAGEQCDDGNTMDGDCCDSACQFEAASSPCPPGGNPCMADVCDGAGGCGVPLPFNTMCPADGNDCTDDVCDGAGACGVDNTDLCDDNDACTENDVCGGGSCGGSTVFCDDADQCTQDSCNSGTGCIFAVVPTGGCRTAGKTKLNIKNNANDAGDKILWKWQKGESTTFAEFGSPTTSTAYALCIYAGTGSASIAIPPVSGWTAKVPKLFKYKDTTASPDGAFKVKLKAGPAGKSQVQVKAKGENIPDTLVPAPMELPLPVTVQVVNSTNSTCFEQIYTLADVKKNTATLFKAKTSNP